MTQGISQASGSLLVPLADDLMQTKMMTIEDLIESQEVYGVAVCCSDGFVKFINMLIELYLLSYKCRNALELSWEPSVTLSPNTVGIMKHAPDAQEELQLLLVVCSVLDAIKVGMRCQGIFIFTENCLKAYFYIVVVCIKMLCAFNDQVQSPCSGD
jgi:hypothetical protein